MRKYFLLVIMVGLGLPLLAQEAAKSAEKVNGPAITFEKKTHDFGEIVQGDKVEHTFYFTNTGTEPLIITNVEVTCGCTTPKGWPRDPIPPGAGGELTVGFNSTGKIGRVNKTVRIVSNASNQEGGILTFTTTILEKNASKPQ